MVLSVTFAALAAFVVAGCSNNAAGGGATPLSKEEESRMRAPLGQPMPPEARAAMEKANQDARAKQGSAPTGP
jgi:hypothetical protein